MSRQTIMNLDTLIHAPIRLAILSVLMTAIEADFSYLKGAVEATDGNLSTHLKKLEQAGYVSVSKSFEANKPRSRYQMTDLGRKKFTEYIDSLQSIVQDQKGKQ